MRSFVLTLPLLFVLPASASLNDRDSDSLATQAAKFPNTLRVITGRFERNPPLFYQMRIERESAQLKRTPRDFALYDDIGVALDKLHRDEEALQIMAKKRALLPPFDAKNPAMKEAWYRYFANTGTFHAHRYLGEKSGDVAEIKTARGMIKRAIEIKPNAHFGREKYQLMVMDWILKRKTRQTQISLSTWIDGRGASNPRQHVEGLSGLIVLGAAWQSVDIFPALSHSLRNNDTTALAYLAYLRTQELFKQGHKSLTPSELKQAHFQFQFTDLQSEGVYVGISDKNQKTLQELFPKLRAEAEDENAELQSFMMARFRKGDHPDTNPKFWADWEPAEPPSSEVDWVNEQLQKAEARQRLNSNVKLGLNILSVTILAGFCFWLWRLAKRHLSSKIRS